MQIPIVNGIYTDENGLFRTSYPVNLVPVPKETGLNAGYLKPADGIISFGDGPGVDRGGINWNGICYRVMGTKLVSLSSTGAITIIGDVGGAGQCSFDYSFNELGIASSNNLYYWDGATLTHVTDVNLGNCIDFIWVDNYFMTTDSQYIVVTELGNPTVINPLKYGSSEADPDKVKGLIKVRNEPFAVNRYSIEAFSNIGGTLFPFQRIEGSKIDRGAIGTYAFALFDEAIAFLGGARNEPPSVWVGINGSSTNISTLEIDTIIQGYTEEQLATTIVEVRNDKNHRWLYVHLPNVTCVYDIAASAKLGEQTWFLLSSGLGLETSTYRARNFVWANDKWIVGDPTSTKYGYFTESVGEHYGNDVGWNFNTSIIYNEGNGVIFHEIELVCLTGRVTGNPTIWTNYSTDGITWSTERPRSAGRIGHRDARINWLQQGNMRQFRIQRFRGTSAAHISIARLEARVEPLYD